MAREMLRRWSSQSFGGKPCKPAFIETSNLPYRSLTLHFDDFQTIDVDENHFMIRISPPIPNSIYVNSCRGQPR